MSVRAILELVHREAAALAGTISLLLTQESLTKRDILGVVQRIGRLVVLGPRLRLTAKLPPE